MRRSFLKTSIFAFLILLILGVIDRSLLHNSLQGVAGNIISAPAVFAYDKISFIKKAVQLFVSRKNNASQLAELQDQNHNLESQLAKMQSLEEENSFLRKSLDLKDKSKDKIYYASIFSLHNTPVGSGVMLNQGSSEGIKPGDVVVGEQGVLIGVVEKVWEHTSQVMLVTDGRFNASGRVLSSNTTGLIHGAGEDLSFDLIVQADAISEGDKIFTTGNDQIPAGLEIGTVKHISGADTQVFKQVVVAPSFKDIRLGKVLILSN